jgi:protein involved in polysaccharide export with SLBB domain
VVQYASEPVFFLGAGLKATGLFPLVGQRNLMEMMESNGGLQPGASNRIKVTRHKEEGPIPLPNVIALPNGDTSVEINLKTLQANVNPAENIVLMPFDIVNVDLAGTVSVMGEVGHIGSFALQDRESMPVIQAVIEAGGLSTTAKPEDSFILRPITDTARHAVIPINLKLILKGEGNDQPLLANDVLVVGASHKLSQKDLLIFLPILGLAFTFVNIFAHL